MREFEFENSPMVDGFPAVTLGDIERAVGNVSFFQQGTMTVCILTMDNGHQVVGQAACVVPEKFNQEQGQALAQKDAQNKLWPLLGYELRLKLKGKL